MKACQGPGRKGPAWSGMPQASAGFPLPINSYLAIRNAQRGRDKKASEKQQNPPATVVKRYVPHDGKQDDFSSGTLRSQGILNIPAVWPLTNLEMIPIL